MMIQRRSTHDSMTADAPVATGLRRRNLLIVVLAFGTCLFAAGQANSSTYCSVGSELKAARDAVQAANDRLNRMPPKPMSLGTRQAAEADLKAKTAVKAKEEAIRNAADAALADHRQITGNKLVQNQKTLQTLPSPVQLEAAIKGAEFQLRNQTTAQRTARINLLDKQRSLTRTQEKLNELSKLVSQHEAAIDNGVITGRSEIARVRQEINELKARIAKGRTIATETQKKIVSLTAIVFPTADERRAAEELPENRRKLVLRSTIESENANIQAEDAKLNQELNAAEANLSKAKTAVKISGEQLAAVIRRQREVAQWEQDRQQLENAVSSAAAAMKTKQDAYDIAVRLKDAALAGVKQRTRLSTLNTRNKAFQQSTRTKVKKRSDALEADVRSKIRNQFDSATEKSLLETADAYYKQVYIREQHRAIVRGYANNIQALQSELKLLEPFDCPSFSDAQAYANDLRRWLNKFSQWSSRRTKLAADADRKSKKLAAEFSKIRSKPRIGLTDVVVSKTNVTIRLWDHGSVDGDVVTVVLNKKRRCQVRLTKGGTNVNLILVPGPNTLEVIADNEGTSSPNTASISITNVARGKAQQKWSLKTGQSASMKIHVVSR